MMKEMRCGDIEGHADTPCRCLISLDAMAMSEPHWRKRRREAMERKRNPGFYSKTAGKGFDDMDEGTSFWGHKGLQRRFGKVNGEKPKGLDG